MSARLPRIGILFSQFAAYHVDRCVAAAELLEGRATVLAVEMAQASATYAWAPSGAVAGAEKRVLFTGQPYEAIGRWRKFRAAFAALRGCETVFIGIGYHEPETIALALALRLSGRRVIVMSESKYDDFPRVLAREWIKARLLSVFSGALVGGPRHADYMRFLGFRRRPVLTGYDTVGLARVREQGGSPAIGWAERPFVFVGRFVAKKNIAFLLEAYALYRAQGGSRRLVLVGGGELEGDAAANMAARGLEDAVEITGFVDAAEVSRRLAAGLALLIPSTEEQWGLVVNEALAFALPVVASEAVGSRDTLVHNLVNGFVLAPDAAQGWAAAMIALGSDEAAWQRMSEASRALQPSADTARFGAAVAELAGFS
jgi:L-malate glycosyltransferase